MDDESRLLTLAACKVTARGIERTCPAWARFRRGESTGDRARQATRASIGRRHLGHTSGAVRARAFVWAARGGAERSALLSALRAEKDQAVLQIMVTHAALVLLGPDTAALWLTLADSKNVQIRQRAAAALADRRMAGTAGTLERLMKMIDHDVSISVKRTACSRLGDRGDEAALSLLERHTLDPKADPVLYDSCFFGLVGMWLGADSPSRKAYRLTLARLRAKPRSAHRPPRAVIRRLRLAARPPFVRRAPSWYRGADLIAALADVAADRAARGITRAAAIGSMRALGAPRAAFEALLPSAGPAISKHTDDRVVREALELAMKKAEPGVKGARAAKRTDR